MHLLFWAALKSISGIQEQQSHCGCSVTYFSEFGIWYLWLSGASVSRTYAAASIGARCGDALVVVGDDEQQL